MDNKIAMVPIYQVCVDGNKNGSLTGRLYCGCLPEGDLFHGAEALLLKMDKIMDNIGFPQSTVSKRIFKRGGPEIRGFAKKNREAINLMRKFDISKQAGEKATFILEVRFRQNASWQGTIKWVEKQQDMHFRSALEMIKIIDSALDAGYQVDVQDSDLEADERICI